MRTLWKIHNLRAQTLLLTTGHQPHVQTEPAEDHCDGKGPKGAQNTLHQVHQGDGEIRRLIDGFFPKQKNMPYVRHVFLFNPQALLFSMLSHRLPLHQDV